MDHQIEGFEQTELPYQVRIENFEGPLDLLLHLIKKNEINICDIPIAMIAQQYLAYIEAMNELNLERRRRISDHGRHVAADQIQNAAARR